MSTSELTRRVIALALAAVIPMGLMTGLAHAAPGSRIAGTYTRAVAPGSDADKISGLTQFFEQVNAVPDAVLQQGDAATHAWLKDRQNGGPQARADVMGCVGGITMAIGGALIPAAKILKLKKLVAELGGIKEAVQAFAGAGFSWEKIQALGGPLAALDGELLGITAIRNNCFN